MHASLRRAQRAIAVLFFALGFGYANWLARIPAVRDQLGLDDRELGLTLLAAGLGALVAFRMTSRLIRRHGTRSVGAAGSVAYGLLMALPALAPSGPWAAAALFVAGWFNGLMDVGLNAQAVNIERRLGRPILAALHGAFSLGAFAGASFGAAAASLDWPVALHLAAVGGVLSVVSWVATRALLVEAPAPPEPAVRLRLPPALWLLGAVAFCASVGEGAMAEWSGIYLRDVLHTTMGAAASGYTAFSLAMVTGRLCGDGLVQRFAAGRTLCACGLVAAASLAIGLCVASPGGFAVASLGVGAGLSLVIPLVLRAATALAGINEATALSVVATLGYGGYLLGPPVLGVVAHSYGMRAALATVVAALVGLSWLATRLRPASAAQHAADA